VEELRNLTNQILIMLNR